MKPKRMQTQTNRKYSKVYIIWITISNGAKRTAWWRMDGGKDDDGCDGVGGVVVMVVLGWMWLSIWSNDWWWIAVGELVAAMVWFGMRLQSTHAQTYNMRYVINIYSTQYRNNWFWSFLDTIRRTLRMIAFVWDWQKLTVLGVGLCWPDKMGPTLDARTRGECVRNAH